MSATSLLFKSHSLSRLSTVMKADILSRVETFLPELPSLLVSERDTIRSVQIRACAVHIYIYINLFQIKKGT